MYSYTHFTPGSKKRCSKMINYVSQMNAISPDNIKTCDYSTNEIKKPSSQQVSSNISNKQRISQTIISSIGGRTQFGNYYLGQPVVANYLGRYEGQPGGSGTPLRNRF
jgi:hypothetical protein